MARLAEAHCVSPGDLIANELKSLASKSHGKSYLHQTSSSTESLNSTGRMALELVQALEYQTLRLDLRYLTLLSWADILPPKGLLRRIRAWCPSCYNEWQHNQKPIYEPLLWALETVSICLKHRQQLRSCCPKCQRQLPALAWHSKPGYCSRCYQWLGTTLTPEVATLTTNPDELKWQRWVLENVGKLLETAPSLLKAPTRERISRSLSVCISRTVEGNIAEFARQLGTHKSAVWQWKSGKALPQLSMLLKICQILEIDLLNFLFNPESLTNTRDSLAILVKRDFPSQKPKQQLDTDQVQEFLQSALIEEPPPTMKAVAQTLGHNSRSLRRRFPELCSAISARYLNYRDQVRAAKVQESCQEVRQIALKLYGEGIDPTRSYISRYLSKPAYFREPAVVAVLESTRQELGLKNS
jgi:transcriptional regulator with XRE-family HTH domain